MSIEKPFSPSCVENQAPILAVLKSRLSAHRQLLEIGSGTGQHAVYFAPELPHLQWQTSDCPDQHPGIRLWLEEAAVPNIGPPLVLDVLENTWPSTTYDAAFSANTAHIMSEAAVTAMFQGIGKVLEPGGLFLLYGPFNYDGNFTSPSNADFDYWLRQRDPRMGIRDVAWLAELAAANALALDDDVEMPVNNRMLVWKCVH